MGALAWVFRVAGLIAAFLAAGAASLFSLLWIGVATEAAWLAGLVSFGMFMLLWVGALHLLWPTRPGRNVCGALVLAGAAAWSYPVGAALVVPSPVLPTYEVSSDVAERSDLVLSRGERMALWSSRTSNPARRGVALFVPGGPGGRVYEEELRLLSFLAEAGYDAYGYDHYSGGYSQYPDPDLDLLTVADEVRRLDEIVDEIGSGERVHLLGHSYAGMIVGRYLAAHPEKAASFVAMDTSPLFDLTTGNTKTRLASASNGLRATGSIGTGTLDEAVQAPRTIGFGALSRLSGGSGPHVVIRRLLMVFWRAEGGRPLLGSAPELATAWAFIQHAGDPAPDATAPSRLSGDSDVAQLIIEDAKHLDDYYPALVAADTPPILVLHPERGIVSWRVHAEYRLFFDDVTIVPVPGAGHALWDDKEAWVAEVVTAFFEDRLEPSLVHTGDADPFLSNERPRP